MAGIVAPEVLGGAGIIRGHRPGVVQVRRDLPLRARSTTGRITTTIFWVNMCLMNFAEVKRGQDYWYPARRAETPLMGWEKGFAGSGNPAYPGSKYFNFANLGKDDMATMQKKEIKNGRLAMMAFLGCVVQAAARAKARSRTSATTSPAGRRQHARQLLQHRRRRVALLKCVVVLS